MPDGSTLNYAELRAEVSKLGGQLRAIGINPGDRVAIVLPNGPEMAIAFLAVAVTGCAAPLNPKYRKEEFQFYYEDLKARVLITGTAESEIPRSANPGSIVNLTLNGKVGDLRLTADRILGAPHDGNSPLPEDIALVLHTSGTTSRPKIVPLRHRNLANSAHNIASSLSLTAADRSLNVMPLFHIHGLLAGLLAPLSVGGSVVATNGFNAFRFFSQLQEFHPSYYTAVPTMHQMILARSSSYQDAATTSGLRFVRSSSASLPPTVREELSELFKVPVIEAYGMTEATHQMCCNPFPPGITKPGSVGLPTGIQLTILDKEGQSLPTNQRGEVSIRGSTVIDGYENNPEANETTFSSGWFRTGDEGYVDPDGYLFLTGRLKEQINRGGEKISPLEIEAVLLSHEHVTQAVSFAVPHEKLGEEVAAAVVLIDGVELSERELREFVSGSLAPFKVPKKVLFLDELPKGPTGKVQRIGLAEQLGLEP